MNVVVTGRVTDASVIVAPAAHHFGWSRDDYDAIAGAMAAMLVTSFTFLPSFVAACQTIGLLGSLVVVTVAWFLEVTR